MEHSLVHTLKPVEHDGKNRFSKYLRFLCYFGSQSFSCVFYIIGTIKLCGPFNCSVWKRDLSILGSKRGNKKNENIIKFYFWLCCKISSYNFRSNNFCFIFLRINFKTNKLLKCRTLTLSVGQLNNRDG